MDFVQGEDHFDIMYPELVISERLPLNVPFLKVRLYLPLQEDVEGLRRGEVLVLVVKCGCIGKGITAMMMITIEIDRESDHDFNHLASLELLVFGVKRRLVFPCLFAGEFSLDTRLKDDVVERVHHHVAPFATKSQVLDEEVGEDLIRDIGVALRFALQVVVDFLEHT